MHNNIINSPIDLFLIFCKTLIIPDSKIQIEPSNIQASAQEKKKK